MLHNGCNKILQADKEYLANILSNFMHNRYFGTRFVDRKCHTILRLNEEMLLIGIAR